jgi:hypothetical protein
LLQAINKGGATHLVEADIQNFFPSVNGKALASFLRIQRISLGTQFSPPLRKSFTIATSKSQIGRLGAVCHLASRLSPLIASKLLQPALTSLGAPYTRSFIDNIGFAATSEQEANEKKAALAVLLKEHPAGPFTLKYALTFQPNYDLDVLGYWVRRRAKLYGGGARVTPSRKSILRGQKGLARRSFRYLSLCGKRKLSFGQSLGRAAIHLGGEEKMEHSLRILQQRTGYFLMLEKCVKVSRAYHSCHLRISIRQSIDSQTRSVMIHLISHLDRGMETSSLANKRWTY